MKKILIFPAFLLALALAAGGSAKEFRDAAMLTFYEGDVSIRLNDEADWGAPIKNIVLQEGDSIRTGADGKARIVLEDESSLTIGPLSVFTIDNVGFEPVTGEKNAAFSLNQGMVRAKVAKLTTAGSSFTIQTPSAVAGVRGTDFVVEADPATDLSRVTVLEGEVDVEARIGAAREKVRVLKEQTTDITGGVLSRPGKADSEKLNALRQKLAQRQEADKPGRAEMTETQASALVAIRTSGLPEKGMEGVEGMIESGEIPAGNARDIVHAAAAGVPKDQIVETLQVIRDKNVSREDLEQLAGIIKEKRDGQDLEQDLADFRNDAGNRPDRPVEPGVEPGVAPPEAGRKPPPPGGEVKPGAQLPPPGDIKDQADIIKENIAVNPQGVNPDDPQSQEAQLFRDLTNMGVPKDQIQRLMDSYRAGMVDRFEVEMIAKAIRGGVNPEFIFRLFGKFRAINVGLDIRGLIMKAMNVGLPRDKILQLLDAMEKNPASIDRAREELKNYIETRLGPDATPLDTADLKPDSSVVAQDAATALPGDAPATNTGTTSSTNTGGGAITSSGGTKPPINTTDGTTPDGTTPDGGVTPPPGNVPSGGSVSGAVSPPDGAGKEQTPDAAKGKAETATPDSKETPESKKPQATRQPKGRRR